MPFPPPTITAPPLEDFQLYYNGLTFGAGTAWGILKIEGLDLAEIRNGDLSWPRDHGQAAGLDLYAGRDIIIDFWMKSDGTSLQSAQLALAAATVVRPGEELPLWFKLPNLPTLCVMCRPRKRPLPIDSDYAAANVAKPELTLHATDPRIYNAATGTVLAMGEPPSAGKTAELNNEGNTEMRPVIVFDGPIARPKIGIGSVFLEFIDTDVDEEEAIANEAFFLRLLRGWETPVANLPGYSPTATYLPGEELKTTEAFEIHHRWVCIKETKGGGEPKTGEFWETVSHASFTRAEIEAKEAALHASQKTTEETKQAERKTKEEKGELPTVKTGDQLLVDLGTPHRVTYYPGGIEANEPESVARWLTSDSVWWDLSAGTEAVMFSSIDEKATAGTAEVQWASARQL